jgi:filamentous hemagglutinin family protein
MNLARINFLYKLGCANVFLALFFGISNSQVVAQIIPDATLPTNSSVTPSSNTFTINGGTTAGGNLFHSFREFSVPTGSEAFFNNASTIERIITRVTGGQVSNIDGLIRANGKASLFLINPSGIIFGSNAKLDIGGSFIGSTADSIRFADGNVFSATNSNAPPLLTVNVPIGLQSGANPGEIRVQGASLQVAPGNTLGLVGGDLKIQGGKLSAPGIDFQTQPGGRIELGSLGANQTVNLAPTATGYGLDYGGVQNFRDIQLSGGVSVDASGEPSGNIQVQARTLQVTEGARIVSFNSGSQSGGTIDVNAAEAVEIRGNGLDTHKENLFQVVVGPRDPAKLRHGFFTLSFGSGAAGDIVIKTRSFIARDGAFIEALALKGPGGNVMLSATDSVDASRLILQTTVAPEATVPAGNITINTTRLIATNTTEVAGVSFGNGRGGDLTLNASESVEVVGNAALPVGNVGGFITGIYTTTLGSQDAGNLQVSTRRLILRDGGILGANTYAGGRGGSVNITATDSILISGTSPPDDGYNFPSSIQALAYPGSTNGGGNVTLTTGTLTIRDGANVNVGALVPGFAGSLRIVANSVILDNKGSLASATTSGEGGNIFLQTQNLQLRRNSTITATAGGTGNGGNIALDTNTLAALENSQIAANAFQGRGGNISINAQGIYVAPNSAITASSQLGVAGVVQVNNPETNPNAGLINLPENVTDTSNQVQVGCAANQSNSFTIVGRGGIPEDPGATIRGQTVWQDGQNYAAVGERNALSRPPSQPTPTPPQSQIVEATSWIVNAQGKVELIAQSPNGVGDRFSGHPTCNQ